MNIAIIVLLILCLIPSVLSAVSGYYRRQQLGSVDNKNPRQQYAQLRGIGARAVAAQQNAWEALGLYSAAVLAVSASGVEVKYLAEAALVVLVARVAHAIFYLADLDKLRSVSFIVALIPSVYWFYAAITGI